jgi:hypothetical protein
MAIGRCPETGTPLASQSTVSRFENAPTKKDALRLAGALVDQLTSRITPAHRDIFDIVMLKACSPPARHLLCGLRRPAIGVLECAS